MRLIVSAVGGAIVWIALVEGKTAASLVAGLIIASIAGRIFLSRAGRPRVAWWSVRKINVIARLTLRFMRELVLANAQQLRIVFSPRLNLRPKWAIYPTQLESPVLQVVLSLLISLTPGTVTVARRRDHLVLHLLDSEDTAVEIDRIRDRFESLLLEIER